MIDQNKLKEYLHYSEKTGIFKWMIDRGPNGRIGTIAGTLHKTGYINIEIDYKKYLAHRLAWLYVEGYFPEHQVDHKNRIKSDNRWKNLRHVSQICNSINKSIQSNNRSGITGVGFNKRSEKWRARIKINGIEKHIGSFTHFDDAVIARWNSEKKYNFPNCNS